MRNWFKALDFFIPGLIFAVIIARLVPGPAVHDGPINLHTLKDIGVTVIFFFYGLRLNPGKIKQDIRNWKLHITIQSATFLLFPILVLPFFLLSTGSQNHLLWLGAIFLASLPSTVSSSVVMVSIARGNVPGAIFNASISSLAGIIITPLWMGILLGRDLAAVELLNVLGNIAIKILLPVITGIFLNRYLGKWATGVANKTKIFDQLIILLIVYLSFGKTFYQNLFDSTSTFDLLLMVLFCVTLFWTVFGIIFFTTSKLRFTGENQVTALLAGSQKSLVHGSVMVSLIFPGFTGVGVILLPLIVYHALQLVFSTILANKWGK